MFRDYCVSRSTTTWRDYIVADGQIVAERFNTAGTIDWRYMVPDHLGSITTITRPNDAVKERDSYDAWGKRRNPDATDDPTCSIGSLTTRGYTEFPLRPALDRRSSRLPVGRNHISIHISMSAC